MKGHFTNIACVLNDTHKQDEVVAQAVHVAKRHQAKLTVVLKLDALPPNAKMVMQSFAYLETQTSIESSAQVWLKEKAQTWQEKYPLETDVRVGDSNNDFLKYIVESGFDLVIKLSEADFLERLFGSEDMNLLRKCPCPVWVVHRGNSRQYDTIVACLDLNYHYPEHEVSVRKKLNMDILRYASQVALMEFAQLHIVHVYDAVPENIARGGFISVDENNLTSDLQDIYAERDAELERLLSNLDEELDEGALEYLAPQRHIIHGYPRRDIAITARSLGAKAVVMGTVARIGVPGFIMGGTAEETISQLDCAVLGIKPEGFISPVNE
ncbi:universal stress protein [Salinimonas sp. HHU 13199]|uniref:Universal stress protein n=1 Tax=Salinimonas profundi TaxID=2729140 RepID=A0ABR8LN53_9ALTE|nr:universal stress protein [Salinimonas profundi]MBD3585514.1 universal stress protein [Salinimonas profundi]